MHPVRLSRLLPVVVGCVLAAGASPSLAAPPVVKAPPKLPTTGIKPLPPGPSSAATAAIDAKHEALGGDTGFLGKPTSTQQSGADGGAYRHYQNGSIFWSPDTEAHEVHGLIRDRFEALGWDKSWLGYPMTDEIDTYAKEGRVTKFQGGDLIWRRATNKVSDVKATDLQVDLPTPEGEGWEVLRANGASHQGRWAHCYDLTFNGNQPKTKGRKNVASATAKVVWVEDEHEGTAVNNGIAQRLGVGRYASTLHSITGSYHKYQDSGLGLSPQGVSWDLRPVIASGTVISETGDVGVSVPGAYHIHYCITTAPDFEEFGPFESLPFVFRNYDLSKDRGKTWTPVTTGVPRTGDWVRRRAGSPKAAKVTTSVDVLDFGKVTGTVRLPSGMTGTVGGKVEIAVVSEWGEPLASVTYTTSALNKDGPWTYSFAKVPNYESSRLQVSYVGKTSPSASVVSAKSGPFGVDANESRTVDVTMTATKIK